MAFFSKKQKKTANAIISTLIIATDDNKDLDKFNAKLANINIDAGNSDTDISLNINQHKIPISNIKQSTKSVSKLKLETYDIVIFFHCDGMVEQLIPICRDKNNSLFIIIFSNNANESAIFRETLFKLFCNMVTKDMNAISKVYEIISMAKSNYINYADDENVIFYNCPYPNCGVQNLTENDLWHHCPLYHIGRKNIVRVECPICSKKCGMDTPYQVHLRNNHGLCATHKCEPEYKHGTATYVFSLVVVRRKSDNKFLLVQEFASCGFWLPGGRVDPGETAETAALRECEEEAGVKIELKGILKIEYRAFRFENRKYQHVPDQDYNRMRIIYYAEPVLEDNDENEQKQMNEDEDNNNDEKDKGDGCLLAKSIPDYESMGACWVEADEIMKVKLRGYEPSRWIPYVADGGNIYPMELLECEQRNKIM